MRNKKNYNSYHKEYQLKRYHKRRAEAIDKLGGKCVACGISNDLHIDHIDYSKKEIAINKLWGISDKRFYAELEKCQLLCRKHHEAKTLLESLERRPITHGLYWATFKYKCKCNICLEFKTEYNKKRREKRNNMRL